MMDCPWVEGYRDGRDITTPHPGPNRDPRYVHSWRVGRAEVMGRPIPAAISRARAVEARVADGEERT